MVLGLVLVTIPTRESPSSEPRISLLMLVKPARARESCREKAPRAMMKRDKQPAPLALSRLELLFDKTRWAFFTVPIGHFPPCSDDPPCGRAADTPMTLLAGRLTALRAGSMVVSASFMSQCRLGGPRHTPRKSSILSSPAGSDTSPVGATSQGLVEPLPSRRTGSHRSGRFAIYRLLTPRSYRRGSKVDWWRQGDRSTRFSLAVHSPLLLRKIETVPTLWVTCARAGAPGVA